MARKKDTTATAAKWSVTRLKSDDEGIVTQVYWRILVSDGDRTVVRNGSVALPVPGKKYKPVPYADLTEELVLSWALDVMGKVKIKGELSGAEMELERKQGEDKLPWNKRSRTKKSKS